MSLEIKNTIAILCKLINVLYQTNLKPEYFRLAKFNKSEENVVPALWDALIKITQTSNISEIVNIMHNMNYKRRKFYTYFDNNAKSIESRELLFAITYLLSNNLSVKVRNEIKNSVFSENYINICGDFQFTSRTDLNELENFSESDLQNYTKWLQGQIIANQNMLSEYKNQINHMQKKLNEKMNSKSQDKLTVYELLALRNKNISESFNRNAELTLNLLTIYTGWLKKEKIFWKWMETVINEEKSCMENA